MIPELDENLIDLGRDATWITDKRHSIRQRATVNHLLEAFCGPVSDRREIQLLADEVGLGKTFVALSVAYTILSVLRDKERAGSLDDLAQCYRCVVVITPGGNPTLTEKWVNEAEALLTRCSKEREKTDWFESLKCESPDALLQAVLRADDLRRNKPPVILVAQSSVFTKRLSDSSIRFFTACLFRWWKSRLQKRQRAAIVRGLADQFKSEDQTELWDWSRHKKYLKADDAERKKWKPDSEEKMFSGVSVTYSVMEEALRGFEGADAEGGLEGLLQLCKQVPLRRPGDRRTKEHRAWSDWFAELRDKLRDVFKHLWPYLLRKQFPLVITDEAHHWRNNEAADFERIRKFIAPSSRRMLLLTATPFQLDPKELIQVLNVIEGMEGAIGKHRASQLTSLREKLEDRMEDARGAGKEFSEQWGMLAGQLGRWDPKLAESGTRLPDNLNARTEAIRTLWEQRRKIGKPEALQPFFDSTEKLRIANEALGKVMQRLVVRHRRDAEHRLYWVGREFPPSLSRTPRPDQSQLHLEAGQPLAPKDELVQYLLMKVVAELSRGRHRTALGTALTGCYSTFWASREGRAALASREGRAALKSAKPGVQPRMLKLLQRLTGKGNRVKDGQHPKLSKVVDEVVRRWERGEKSLIFCFRIPTAKALEKELAGRIEKSMEEKRAALLKARGTNTESPADQLKAMQQFRRSLTARAGSGIPLFLDRVLVGCLLEWGMSVPNITESDVAEVACLAARSQIRGRFVFENTDRPDRVFLHRALECVWARRLSGKASGEGAQTLLEAVSQDAWVCYRYGQSGHSSGGNSDDGESTERAARSSLAACYTLVPEPDPERLKAIKEALWHCGKPTKILMSLVEGPNLFAPGMKSLMKLNKRGSNKDACKVIVSLREALFKMARTNGTWDWHTRSNAIDAFVRAILRDDMLLRLPVGVFRGHHKIWADKLFVGCHQPLNPDVPGETLAKRFSEFLGEVSRMADKEAKAYLANAMKANAKAVELVTGATKADTRTAIFSGFNTPLLPEILICTAVGQEGIDLHRECRHVIHYDLGWNPATLEQRTGRVDRIGSKAERVRKLEVGETRSSNPLPGLDVALPYLAATYDERMFEALRIRDQAFEILTGGNPTADPNADALWRTQEDEGSHSEADFVALPAELLDSLRVKLEVRQ